MIALNREAIQDPQEQQQAAQKTWDGNRVAEYDEVHHPREMEILQINQDALIYITGRTLSFGQR